MFPDTRTVACHQSTEVLACSSPPLSPHLHGLTEGGRGSKIEHVCSFVCVCRPLSASSCILHAALCNSTIHAHLRERANLQRYFFQDTCGHFCFHLARTAESINPGCQYEQGPYTSSGKALQMSQARRTKSLAGVTVTSPRCPAQGLTRGCIQERLISGPPFAVAPEPGSLGAPAPAAHV